MTDVTADWPFWAPSRRDAVSDALTLADVGPGTHVVDLGCGDGQVVLLAAERGARAEGIEADPDLAELAREHLDDAGVDAVVRTADLFDPDLDLTADVWFAYLAPATLQRLLPRLQQHPGTLLVTVDFDVPGLIPTRRGRDAQLYRMPGRRARRRPVGWETAGTLVSTVPDVQSLTCLELRHPAGATAVSAAGDLARVVTVLAGADHLDEPGALAVDLRWEGCPTGTVAAGTITTAGAGDHLVAVVFDDDTEGVWDLTPDGVEALCTALDGPRGPTTLDDVLDLVGGIR